MSARHPRGAVLLVGALTIACGGDTPTPTAPPVASAKISIPSPPPETVYGWITGGGRLIEGDLDLSFAGQVRSLGTEWSYVAWADADRWDSWEVEGEWVVRFHNVPNPELTGKTFKSTSFLDASVAWKRTPTPVCTSRYVFTVEGELDGEPGWVAWIVMADAGHRAERGARDSFRMALWAPGDHPEPGELVFDTFEAMTPNAICFGAKKRELANGNLFVHLTF